MSFRLLLPIWFLVSLLTGRLLAAPNDPVGSWVGQWQRDDSLLEVEVTFARTASGYAGSFSAAQLRAVGIPFARIDYQKPRLTWELVGDATTTLFEGKLNGSTLSGSFHEGPGHGTFRLTRVARALSGVQEEEVTFTNGSVRLSGTVVYPVGAGPFPGVVFLHGSGAEGRWASRYLANTFARRGVAALIYDKRGVGTSSGDWRDAGFAELVADAAAAVEALRARPRIAADRLGIHGHSQGGTIAPWVANASPHVAFIVASAASGMSPAETEIYSLANSVGARRLLEPERRLAERYVRAIVATAYAGKPRASMESVWREVRHRSWSFAPPPESDFYWSFSRRIASYDALAFWRRVSAPALLIYGEGDERVPPRDSAARIANAYLGAQGRSLEVLFFPGADHTFRLPPSAPNRFQWPRSAPGYPDRVIEWILNVARP